MANLKAQFAIVSILGLPILIGAAIFGPAAFDLAFRRRPPERYLIPAGFTGWVRIDYRQKNAPSLPTESGHRLVKLDTRGKAVTSSDPPNGHGSDDFYYYSNAANSSSGSTEARTPISSAGVCKGGMVWDLRTMLDEHTSMPVTRFFVGTEEQYRREVDPLGKILPNCG